MKSYWLPSETLLLINPRVTHIQLTHLLPILALPQRRVGMVHPHLPLIRGMGIHPDHHLVMGIMVHLRLRPLHLRLSRMRLRRVDTLLLATPLQSVMGDITPTPPPHQAMVVHLQIRLTAINLLPHTILHHRITAPHLKLDIHHQQEATVTPNHLLHPTIQRRDHTTKVKGGRGRESIDLVYLLLLIHDDLLLLLSKDNIGLRRLKLVKVGRG
jgi:hypothetical protein